MPLQNRVAPNGEIVAIAARGTLMGNRGGRFHRDDKTLGKRRWAGKAWICCELSWKDAHHEPMGPGYTSLFFLDEVTALAAGHRPCFFCRRNEAQAFLGDRRASTFDQRLHEERMAPKAQGFPGEGAMVEISGEFYARRGNRLLHWTFAGYDRAIPVQTGVKLLTPPSITAILALGYQPRWHASALQWDGT